MRSSYTINDYGAVFGSIIDAFKPITCVELGILDGYSTAAIGFALRDNGRGHLWAYDLFEDYQYKHGSKDQVEENIKILQLKDIVTIEKADAYTVHERYADNSVDFLHVDISNDGDVVDKMMELWDPKMRTGGIICFEGGTAERDQVEWMAKYNKRPIKPAIEQNKIIEAKYIFGTYLAWPGLTMLLKKRE